ncbi:MAG: hypothetical protein ACRDTQ_12520 [Micromonosporaceae bacterium]
MTADDASATRYWAEFDRFSRFSRTRVAQRLERVLLAAERGALDAPDTAAELAETVFAARDVGVVLDQDLRSRISMALKRLLTAYGSGGLEAGADDGDDSRAGRHLGELRALLEELGDPAADPLGARIASANVHARTDGAAIRRGSELATALTLCRTNREHVEVAIMYAQYQVDIGAYRTAARLVAGSRGRVSSDDSCADLLPEVTACEGGLLFAQGRLRSAGRRFRDTLAVMDRLSRNHRERPAAKAYHYLGKIHALYGRHDLAARDLVRAEELVARRPAEDPRQSGHNHARLGEVLAQAGSPDAHWHLSLARDLFLAAGEESSGRGQHDGVAAVPGEKSTKQIERHESMLRLARSNLHWRGVVIASVRLALINARRGAWWSALRHAWGTLAVGVRLARGSGIRHAAAGVVELALAYAARIALRARAWLLRLPPPRCPCCHCSPRRDRLDAAR